MINILIAGDFIPPETYNCQYSDDLKQVLMAKDFSIVNLETPLTTSRTAIIKTGRNFKRHPNAINNIKDGFFDAVTLANNHIRDYGDEGVLDTIKTCRINNIFTIGAGQNLEAAAKPLQLNIKGKKVSILNYSEREFNVVDEHKAGANPFDLIDVYQHIKSQKEKNDILIVIYHGGLEYVKYPTPQILKTFRCLADFGADAVIAHHTHFYSGVIEHQGKPLVFSLGNFFAETSTKNPKPELSIGLLANLCFNEDNKVTSSLIPVSHNTTNKVLSLVSDPQKTQVLDDIQRISNVILNKRKLNNIWEIYFQKEKGRLYNNLASDSKIEYSLRKRIPYLHKISSYKAAIVLNLMRCDSHRFKTIEILERLLK